MMNERRRSMPIVQVDHYDGQAIFVDHELVYELGGYLGGGAAGVVYEAFSARSKQPVAIKILNPVGYKLYPTALLSRCLVAVRGSPVDPPALHHDRPTLYRSPHAATDRVKLRPENVWWLVHPTSKQAIAAFEDPSSGAIRELTLPQCMDVWGALPALPALPEAEAETFREVHVKGQVVRLPLVPRKFQAFATTRRLVHREVSHMSSLEPHAHVLQLLSALELVQDSKCTTFLVLELAAGGELFDRIKLDAGTDEQTARRYFSQLVSGVAFCHTSGVCHRDLKPENLLLADEEDPVVLKIADFGLSAIFAGFADADTTGAGDGRADGRARIRRLRSVVGSPHYVAPEVLADAGGAGYDGAKADAWSIGVILYAMLAGSLPFGRDLLSCSRYHQFRQWAYQTKYSDPVGGDPVGGDPPYLDDPVDDSSSNSRPDVFPSWFFPSRFSLEVKSLLAQLLYPDPTMRLAVEDAKTHPWVVGSRIQRPRPRPTSPNHVQAEPTVFRMDVGPSSTPPEPVASPTPSLQPTDETTKGPPTMVGSRVNLVVDVSPDVDQLRVARRVDSSPSTSGLSFKANSPLPSRPSPSSPAVAMSPLYAHRLLARSPLPPGVNLMPSVDETAPLSPPPTSQDDDTQSKTIDHQKSAVEPLAALPAALPAAVPAPHHLHKFVSPPLASTASQRPPAPPYTGLTTHRQRRNSPPEIFLRGFDRASIQIHELSALDSLSLSPPDRPTALPDALPGSTTPPSYRDLVARSTRFLTTAPAPLVLARLEAVLTTDVGDDDRVVVDWDTFQLQLWRGPRLVCTVHVFLYQRGVYLVEFRRGQEEIFVFKRFYEDVRAKMSESMGSGELLPLRRRHKSVSGNLY